MLPSSPRQRSARRSPGPRPPGEAPVIAGLSFLLGYQSLASSRQCCRSPATRSPGPPSPLAIPPPPSRPVCPVIRVRECKCVTRANYATRSTTLIRKSHPVSARSRLHRRRPFLTIQSDGASDCGPMSKCTSVSYFA